MPQLCLYLQLHQPFRLDDFNVFDLDSQKNYFAQDNLTAANAVVFKKVAEKSYLPMLKLLKKLSQKHADFKVALSASGVFLEQAQLYQPQVIKLLQDLAQTGQVEFLAETYYHSLASLYSPAEFKKQVKLHQDLIKKLFNQTPQIFRNTELIYSDQIGQQVADLGFKGLLTEAVDRFLEGRDKTQVFWANLEKGSSPLPLLLKHAQLSDDIAFRFSDRNWPEYPLSVGRYLEWLEIYGEDQIVNLFMDFETFGEHQWADTGIFEFFAELIDRFLAKEWNQMVTPSQVLLPAYQAAGKSMTPVYNVPQPISWADIDRDLTAWVDNDLQQDTLKKLYELEKYLMKWQTDEKTVKKGLKQEPDLKQILLSNWRYLQTSDHFYYMCIKWSADGDVHAYFSPYESPFEAYRRYCVVLADLSEKVKFVTNK